MCKSCASCIRVLMIIFNILFTIIGLTVLAAGLYFYFSTFGLQGSNKHNFLAYACIGMASIGALSVVLGILGCCGSYHYSRCLLGTYFFLLLLVFAAEIALGVAGFVYQDEVDTLVHETLKEGMMDLRSGSEGIKWMDTIQTMLQCCGYNGLIDYGISPPLSCCLSKDCSVADYVMKTGCKRRVTEIMHNYVIMCITVIIIAFVELIGLIFAMTLCCAVTGREPLGYHQGVHMGY